MVHGPSGSNYLNRVNTFYRYQYSALNNSRPRPETSPAPFQGGAGSGYVNRGAAEYVAGIRENARTMLDSLGSLLNLSTFNRMRAVSSNEEAITVEDGGRNRMPRDMSVSVTQVAAAQENEGTAMRSDDAYVSSGTRQFEIETGGRRYRFSVSVNPGDTNLDVQQRMADAINSRNIGVTASVGRDSANNTSVLSVQSNDTGSGSAFTIRDVEGSLASATGINTTTREAQDAIYRVNGGEAQSSASNRIELGNGVEVMFRQATTGDVRISAERDTGYAQDAVRNMVNVYNDLMASAGGSNRLTNDLTSAFRTYAPSLERLGISANADGTLEIDEARFSAAVENGNMERFFTGSINGGSYGFTGRLSQIARNAEWNTPMYLNNSNFMEAAQLPRSTPFGFGQNANSFGYYMNGTYNNISGYLFDLYA